jgi:hypothetical protein
MVGGKSLSIERAASHLSLVSSQPSWHCRLRAGTTSHTIHHIQVTRSDYNIEPALALYGIKLSWQNHPSVPPSPREWFSENTRKYARTDNVDGDKEVGYILLDRGEMKAAAGAPYCLIVNTGLMYCVLSSFLSVMHWFMRSWMRLRHICGL